MAFEQCVNDVVKASAGTMAREDARKALSDIFDRAEELKAQGLAAGDPIAQAAQELAEKEKLAAKLDRIRALRNAGIRDTLVNDVAQAGGITKAYDVLRAAMHGLNTLGRNSVESAWHGVTAGWQSALDNHLVKIGMKKAAQSGELDRQMAVSWH